MTQAHRGQWIGVALLVSLLCATAQPGQAQNAVISGSVTSEDGRTVYAASVDITTLNVGVLTSAEGRYRIEVPAPRVQGQEVTLRVRAFGYRPSSRLITLNAGEQTADFLLGLDVNLLEAVVVTGQLDATASKMLAHSVTSIDASQLPVPTVNPLAQLRGKVPGANIVAATGRPGANASVLLRGPKSINAVGRAQGPLVIVDGVVLGSGSPQATSGGMSDLNSLDIERVEVTRGAAASSLYGARAGNGVVQITTKSGRNAPSGVTFRVRSEAGVSDVEGEILLARNHSLMMDERNTRFCEVVTNQPLCSSTFDWNAEVARINDAPGNFALEPKLMPVTPNSQITGAVLRQAFQVKPWPGQTYSAVQQTVDPKVYTQQSAEMTVRSGNTSVFASGSLLEEGGSIRFLEGYRRVSGRLNADQQITDHLSASLRTYYSRGRSDGFEQDGGGRAFFRLTRVPAVVNVEGRDVLGRLYVRPNLIGGGGEQNENPLVSLENTKREDINDRFLGGLRLRYSPLDWLEVEGNFSYDYGQATFSEIRDKGYRATSLDRSNNVDDGSYSGGRIFTGAHGFNAYNSSVNVVVRRTLAPELLSRTNLNYVFNREDTHYRRLSGLNLAVGGVDNAFNATACWPAPQGCATSTFTSQRLMGIGGGVGLEYKERYIADALMRRDGSSLFGSDNRWETYYRGSLAWRVAQEPAWPLKDQIDEFKLRVSRGTAGGRPNFTAQYETYTLGVGGVLTPSTLGNRNLKPETTTETEAGVDLQLFRRVGLTVNYAFSRTEDQILPVPLPAAAGFERQWQNAGTLDNRTWELSLNIPIIQSRDVSWSLRGTYERTRSCISKLNVLPYNQGTPLQGTESMFRIQEGCSTGERFGTFYGRRFLRQCSELPLPHRNDCGGSSSSFQRNDDGYLVWVGAGNSWDEGITKNLWQTSLPAAQAPWGVKLNWGMLIVRRDSGGVGDRIPGDQVPLGHALPDFRYSIAQDFRWKRLTLYALLDASIGQDVWNQGRHWSHLDFNNRDQDQSGKTVKTAKPIGYYYRAAPPSSGLGLGGFYDILAPNNHFVEDASYAKLREASLSYHVGPVGGVGDWDVTVVGRNLFTITGYKGFDPEVGIGELQGLGGTGGQNNAGSAAINAVDAFTFPNLRTVSIALTTRF